MEYTFKAHVGILKRAILKACGQNGARVSPRPKHRNGMRQETKRRDLAS